MCDRAHEELGLVLVRCLAAECHGTGLLIVTVIGSGIAASRLSLGDVGLQPDPRRPIDSAQDGPDLGQPFGNDAEPGPASVLATLEQAGIDELREMVRHRRLRLPHRPDEVARAHLAISRRRDHREQTEPCRIGERLEHRGQIDGLVLGQDARTDGTAALDSGNSTHRILRSAIWSSH
jgi:hypothetical protein